MKLFQKKKYLVIIFIILIIGGYYWYKKANTGDGEVQYATAKAQIGTLTSSISASGNVIVDQTANIDPTITGTVANLSVSVGDKITKGQFLFEIINEDLDVSLSRARVSLTQAQGSLLSAQGSKKQAQEDYNDAKKDDSGKSSLEEKALKDKLEAAKISEIAARESLLVAQKDLASKVSDANERKVVSPIDGTINAINIENGDDLSKLSSGTSRQIPIVIGDLSTMKAEFAVNEVDIANVEIGQKAVLTFDSLPDYSATGKVEKIDSLGTLTQGVVTYNITVEFDDLDARIKPGMSVSVNIITEVKQNALTVPSSAVKSQNGNSFVEVLGNNNSPEQINVKIGASNGTETEITSGLEAGDEVVTKTISGNSGSPTQTNSGSVRVPGLGGFGR